VGRIVVRADGPAIYAVAGRSLFRSEDGSNWRAVHVAESVDVRDVASSREPGSRIFVATDHGVWRSDDAGNIWSTASSGLSDVDVRTVVVTARISYGFS
jgi:ligand-binding sensor domain-containing protein